MPRAIHKACKNEMWEKKSSISGTTAKWRAIIEQEQAVSQTETEKVQRDAGTVEEQQKLVEETREHQVDVEPRFTSKRKNCRIRERDSDGEGVFGRAASSRHCAEVRVRAREAEEMHGKDIRNSKELKNQKQKQSPYQKSIGPTLNAKMMEENNESFQTRH